MAYQNINQYVYKKWYLSPFLEVTDLSLASDERDYNEEVIFSPYIIGAYNGDVLPVKFDINFTGSNQNFSLTYGNYDFDNIFVKPLTEIVNSIQITRQQGLLTNGKQSTGNLFIFSISLL